MKAYQITAPHQGKLIYIPDVDGAHVRYVGVCGTDKKIWRGDMPMSQYPVIPGHEIVCEYNSKPYTVYPYMHCGKCAACVRGDIHCCQNNKTLGVQTQGAMCERIEIDDSRLIPIPNYDPIYTLAEPLGVCIHAASKIPYAKTLLIVGYGNIGRLMAAYAKRNWEDMVVDVLTRESSNYKQYDCCIECAGSAETIGKATRRTLPCGNVILIGHTNEPFPCTETDLIKKELSIRASRNCEYVDMVWAIEELAKNRDYYANAIGELSQCEIGDPHMDDMFTLRGTKGVVVI